MHGCMASWSSGIIHCTGWMDATAWSCWIRWCWGLKATDWSSCQCQCTDCEGKCIWHTCTVPHLVGNVIGRWHHWLMLSLIDIICWWHIGWQGCTPHCLRAWPCWVCPNAGIDCFLCWHQPARWGTVRLMLSLILSLASSLSIHCLFPQYFPASFLPTSFLIVMHSALCNVQSYNVLYSVCMYIQQGRTALYYASWKGHMSVVHLLLMEKADSSICKKVCCNALSCKAWYSHAHVCTHMLYLVHILPFFHPVWYTVIG